MKRIALLAVVGPALLVYSLCAQNLDDYWDPGFDLPGFEGKIVATVDDGAGGFYAVETIDNSVEYGPPLLYAHRHHYDGTSWSSMPIPLDTLEIDSVLRESVDGELLYRLNRVEGGERMPVEGVPTGIDNFLRLLGVTSEGIPYVAWTTRVREDGTNIFIDSLGWSEEGAFHRLSLHSDQDSTMSHPTIMNGRLYLVSQRWEYGEERRREKYETGVVTATPTGPFGITFDGTFQGASGQTSLLPITYMPTSRGYHEDTVMVTHNGSGNPVPVILRGNVSTTGVATPNTSPDRLDLLMTPNPLDDEGQIIFTLPRPGRVRITLYSVDGRRLRTIADREMSAGLQTVGLERGELSPGTFLCQISWSGGERVARVVVR